MGAAWRIVCQRRAGSRASGVHELRRFVQKQRVPQPRVLRHPSRRLMEKHKNPSRAGIYPPAFFFPGPVHQIPAGDDDRARRGNNNNNNNTMALPRGPGPTIAPREFHLILSGIPLSLIFIFFLGKSAPISLSSRLPFFLRYYFGGVRKVSARLASRFAKTGVFAINVVSFR